MYGTRSNFFNDSGSIFRLTANGVHDSSSLCRDAAGRGPSADLGLVHADDGNFYGTQYARGSSGVSSPVPCNSGRLVRAGSRPCASGMLTFSRLLAAPTGRCMGAPPPVAGRRGVAFRGTLDGTLTELYSFGPFEARPFGNLTQGADGARMARRSATTTGASSSSERSFVSTPPVAGRCTAWSGRMVRIRREASHLARRGLTHHAVWRAGRPRRRIPD
jgi:hypothetical protein